MKKGIRFLFIVTLLVLLSGCMDHIEDTNGADTSLVTIDLEAQMAERSLSNRSSISSTSSSGGTTYCFNYDEIDYDTISNTVAKFSGTMKFHCSDLDEGDTLVLTITSNLTSGNLEIIIIDADYNIIETVAVNTTETVTINAENTEYFVVAGGESAEFEMTITREIK